MAVVVRVVMMVVVMPSVRPVAAALTSTTVAAMPVLGRDAPEAVAAPGAFLALFGAVLGAAAAAALCELARVLLPLAALPVCALADAAARVVLAAEVAHDDAGPVGHVVLLRRDGSAGAVARGRGLGGELLDQGEDVVGGFAGLLDELIVPVVV